MIFAGTRPGFPEGMGCRLTASLAWIVPAGRIPPGIGHRRPTAVIHGIPAYELRSGPGSVLYLVPELGVRAGARGPLARRVLATLTWSPLAVAARTLRKRRSNPRRSNPRRRRCGRTPALASWRCHPGAPAAGAHDLGHDAFAGRWHPGPRAGQRGTTTGCRDGAGHAAGRASELFCA
jgi:hypothetical protein